MDLLSNLEVFATLFSTPTEVVQLTRWSMEQTDKILCLFFVNQKSRLAAASKAQIARATLPTKPNIGRSCQLLFSLRTTFNQQDDKRCSLTLITTTFALDRGRGFSNEIWPDTKTSRRDLCQCVYIQVQRTNSQCNRR